MPLAGTAFLALWNDIAREREPEYDRWHTREHVPERCAVAGFHGARRYVARHRPHHRYFTLYEVAGLAVLDSAEYRDLIDHPTPWSMAMRPDFANFLRAPCRTLASAGDGIGAALALLCYDAAAVDGAVEVERLARGEGVVACHLGQGEGGAPATPWSREPAATAPRRAFDRVLLIEALDRAHAHAALAAARDALDLPAHPDDFGHDVYDLACVFPGHDAGASRRHRRPQWDA